MVGYRQQQQQQQYVNMPESLQGRIGGMVGGWGGWMADGNEGRDVRVCVCV